MLLSRVLSRDFLRLNHTFRVFRSNETCIITEGRVKTALLQKQNRSLRENKTSPIDARPTPSQG